MKKTISGLLRYFQLEIMHTFFQANGCKRLMFVYQDVVKEDAGKRCHFLGLSVIYYNIINIILYFNLYKVHKSQTRLYRMNYGDITVK